MLILFDKFIETNPNFDKLRAIKKSTNNHRINALIDHFLIKYNPASIREIGKSHYYRNILDDTEGNIAFQYLQKAASFGDKEALFYLAHSYENGIGCSIDKNKAMNLFSQLAQSGFQESIKYLEKKNKMQNMQMKEI